MTSRTRLWSLFITSRNNVLCTHACMSLRRNLKRLSARFASSNKFFHGGFHAFRQTFVTGHSSRSQLSRGLRRRTTAARLLRLWVQIPAGAWMFVCCECCVLTGRVLCVGPITRPEEFYRLWCVVVCDLETSWMRRPWPTGGCCIIIKRTGQ